jgi:hypothetical protein
LPAGESVVRATSTAKTPSTPRKEEKRVSEKEVGVGPTGFFYFFISSLSSLGVLGVLAIQFYSAPQKDQKPVSCDTGSRDRQAECAKWTWVQAAGNSPIGICFLVFIATAVPN